MTLLLPTANTVDAVAYQFKTLTPSVHELVAYSHFALFHGMTEHFNQVDKQLSYTNKDLNLHIAEYVIGNGKFQDKAFWGTEDHLVEAHECINKFLQIIDNVIKHRTPPNSRLPWAKCFDDILNNARFWFRVIFFRTMISNHHLSPMEKNIFGRQYAVDKANHEINSRAGVFPTKQQ
jgi:hypothetical protein